MQMPRAEHPRDVRDMFPAASGVNVTPERDITAFLR
jgi:hypothetical protein